MTGQLERLKAALADRYAIERELGSGGMATVYLARDVKHDRLVAVKVLDPELAASLGAERFLREIQVTAKLNHPHILPLYDSGSADGFVYYIMPFVEGESLADKIARDKQLSIKEAVQITREVAEALVQAHSYGLVHRDIKPANILMSGGHAIVADFGIAAAVSQAGGEKLTKSGTTVGTPAYMSPEQGMGSDRLDGRSDIYSLGCVLFEMLCGQVPFTGTTPQQVIARHSMDHVPPPHIMRDTIPDALDEIILRAMAKLPADRYRTAYEMAEALGQVDVTTAVHRVSPTLEMRARRRRQRRVLLGAVAAVGALALGGAAWALFGGRRAAHRPAAGGLDLKHVAVLYFDDLSPDSSLGPIADGLAEGLIQELAQVRALSVVSRNGVAAWRASNAPRDSVARALATGTLVVGSIEPAGRSALRVTTRLVDGASGADVGRRASFEFPRDAVLAARDSIARDVARTLREWLGEEIELSESRAGTSSAVAWTLLQQAERLRKLGDQQLAQGDSAPALVTARRSDSLLSEANRADPQWVEPAVLQGQVTLLLARATSERGRRIELVQQALAQAERARRLAPRDAMVFELRGTLRYALWRLDPDPNPAKRRTRLDSAYADLQAAVRADPMLASAYATLSRLDHDREDLVEEALAARSAYDADAYLRDAPGILYRLFFASYNIAQFAEARRSCDEGAPRFPGDYRFAECQLFLLTIPDAKADVARAWLLAARTDSLAPAPLRPFQRRRNLTLVGAVLGRARLSDSAQHVFLRARTDDPKIDPDQELAGYEAAMRTLGGDPDGAIGLLKRYVAAHPEHSFQIGGTLHWWWRDLERRPDFQSVLRARR
jgi:serine/threonine-protein kinase